MPNMTRFFKRSEATIIVGCVLIFIIFALIDAKDWFSFFTIRNITRFTAVLGFIAIGETLLILVKEIDLSVGSVYGIVAIAFVSAEPVLGIYGSFVAALLLAAVIGWLNAVLVLKGRLSSMIVTLGGLFFYRGLIYVTTGGTARSFTADVTHLDFVQLFGGNWILGLENGLWWFLLVVIFFSYVLFRLPFGNHLLAIGGNRDSAISRGVRVDRVKTVAFVLCSMLAGFAGMVSVADQPRVTTTIGQDLELEAIAAAVIGGALLSGGKGSIIGAALGTFFFTAVRSMLITLGAPALWYQSFVGLVLIFAAVVNVVIQRRLTGTPAR
jgi:simple sugar transport system permease protein